MASKEELDLDVQPKPAGKKHLLLYIVIGVLVLALGGVSALFFLKGGDKGKEEAAAEAEAGHEAVKEAHYLPLQKLVVNFSQRGPARFLQVDLQVMSYDPAALKALEENMPMVRNDILLLLGGQTYEEVSTPAGKEKLRAAILAAVQHILDQYAKGKKAEAVYFTEFVMQ